MPLSLHLFIHFILAVLMGYLVGACFKDVRIGIIFGILGGFLIDLDHVLEYFLVFGPTLNLRYFFESRQFLASGRTRLYFHAWEYAPILLLGAVLLRKFKKVKVALVALALAGSLHLISDVIINDHYFNYYSISYRAKRNYSSELLLTPEQYSANQGLKLKLGID